MLKLINKYQNGRNIQYDEDAFRQYIKNKGYSKGLLGSYYYPRGSSVSIGTKEHIVKSKDYQDYVSKAPKQKQNINNSTNDNLFDQYIKDKRYSKGLTGTYYYPKGSSVSVGTKEHLMKSKDYQDYVTRNNNKRQTTPSKQQTTKQQTTKKEKIESSKSEKTQAQEKRIQAPKTPEVKAPISKPVKEETPKSQKSEAKNSGKPQNSEKPKVSGKPQDYNGTQNSNNNIYYTNNTYKRVANSLGLNSKEEVKAFQRKLGVKDDGVWGINTQKAYQNSKQKTINNSNFQVNKNIESNLSYSPINMNQVKGLPAEIILQKYQAMTPRSMSSENYIKAMQELESSGNQDWIPSSYNNRNNMEEVQKNQTGGTVPQDDVQSQIIQLVQAAMQGDEQAVQQIQQIQQAAEQGNQEAVQIMEMINQVIQQMQGGQTQVARQGAKLNYIKKLRGECPEGFEMAYFKIGGKVCKKCQKMKNKVQKDCGGNKVKMHRAGGIMNDILIEMYSKGGSTAFGDRSRTPASANAQGRYGGRKAFNPNGTHQLDQHSKPNKFTAFGDEGKKKPTNSGLTGHHATGKAGRMQNKQSAGITYKATAFGGDKQKRYYKGTGGVPRSGLRTIPRYPKGQGGKSGIGRMENGGSLNGIPFFRTEE